eukprot:scaffold29103_cov92-Amphora_coffeaeformis.AAC.1
MQFTRDADGTLCLESKKYLQEITENYERHFGSKPRTVYLSPIEKGDHPEVDTTEFLDEEKIK